MKTQNKSDSKSKVPEDGLFPEIIRENYKGSDKLKDFYVNKQGKFEFFVDKNSFCDK